MIDILKVSLQSDLFFFFFVLNFWWLLSTFIRVAMVIGQAINPFALVYRFFKSMASKREGDCLSFISLQQSTVHYITTALHCK